MSLVPASQWEAFLSRFPDAHLLQTLPWGLHKQSFGWQPFWLLAECDSTQIGAQVLVRKLPLGLRMAYLPKGPVFPESISPGRAWEALLPEIDSLCHRQRALFFQAEPDLWEGEAGAAVPAGFSQGTRPVQPPRTLVVDISGDEEGVLMRMKQKTRYNIRLAQKKGVRVIESPDILAFYQLMQTTGERDAFGVHGLAYYQAAYDLFHPLGWCVLLLAEYSGELLAGLMVFAHGSRGWYLYGASSNAHRELMASYLLQWEAMRWARKQGCTQYDLWGVPDASEERLESDFGTRSDGLWGVYRFKRGFGGALERSAGPWVRVYNQPLYAVYRWLASRRLP